MTGLQVPADASNFAPYSIDEGAGFDRCGTTTLSQLQAWWNSPTDAYFWFGFYIGGPALGLGCTVPSPQWVDSVFSTTGLALVPIWVGRQAPSGCNPTGGPYSSSQSIDIPPSTAVQEGINDAQTAVNTAAAEGFLSAGIVYDDMEAYTSNNTVGGYSCSLIVDSYLNGWDYEIGQLFWTSGVYGSEASTISNLVANAGGPGFHEPNNVWIACYYVPGQSCPGATVWNMPDFGNWAFVLDQRHHQFHHDQCETYANTPITIDSNVGLAGVAGGWNESLWDGSGEDEVNSPTLDPPLNLSWRQYC